MPNPPQPLSLTPTLARRLAVSRQRLAGARPTADLAGVTAVIDNIHCLQIDPIRAVERTQYLVLWSRLGCYEPALLAKLLFEERQLFEYWAHAASIVRTGDYPIFRRHMADWLSGSSVWMNRVRQWLVENEPLRQHILEELTGNGAMPSRAFEDRSKSDWHSSGWTSGRNVSRMLAYMWTQGEIMVARRKGLTKFWDLTERCLPEETPRQELAWPDVVREAAQKSLRALGVARKRHIRNHFTRDKYPDLDEILAGLVTEGKVLPVEIIDDAERWPGNWYVHSDDLPLVEALRKGAWQPRTTLLSPFDNLICDRERSEQLFGFYYRIEIYVPKDKRQYGYYVLPILHGDRLIGRIDPKMDRKSGNFYVNNIYVEEGERLTAEKGRAVAGAVEELATFLGAREIIYGSTPTEWQKFF